MVKHWVNKFPANSLWVWGIIVLLNAFALIASAQNSPFLKQFQDIESGNSLDTARLSYHLKNLASQDDRNRFLIEFRRYLDGKSSKAEQKIDNSQSFGAWFQQTLYNTPEARLAKGGLPTQPKLTKQDSLKYKNHKRISGDQNINVFGWHPYWNDNTYKSYNFQLLTVLSWFSYDINPESGDYKNVESIISWRKTDIVELAHAGGCKVLMTMTIHDKLSNIQFLSGSLKIQQNAIDSIIALVASKGGDGIDINFEDIPAGYGPQFIRFVNTLTKQAKSKHDKWMVTLTLPAFDKTNVYEMKEFTPEIDLFVIMGYSFKTTMASKPSPVAPLNLQTKPNVEDVGLSVDTWLKKGIKPGQLLLGVPYYGISWRKHGGNYDLGQYMSYGQIRDSLDAHPGHIIGYDAGSTSCYASILVSAEESEEQYIWYDSDSSLAAKYDWVINKKLGGVGIWALGYDNGHNELWALLDKKFTEYQIPPPNRAKSTFIRTMRQYGNIIVVAIAFILVFLIGGFAVSLFDWRVREVLFQIQAFRILYFCIFIAFLLVFLLMTDVLTHTWGIIITLFFSSAIIAFLISRIAVKQRSKLP